jgi:dolichol-phosphate mannosyltransferase
VTTLLAVVLPCLNEVESMPRIIREIRNSGLGDQICEILVVDDGSTDGTREILKKISTQDRNLKLIFTTKRLGLAKSVYEGISSARSMYIAAMDVDGMHNPVYLKEMLQKMDSGCDLVIGSRYVKGGRSQGAIYPQLSRAVNLVIQKIMGSRVKDQLCGFFMAKSSLLLGVPEQKFRGFGEYFIGVVSHFENNNASVYELPTIHSVRVAGTRKSRRLKMLIAYLKYALGEKSDNGN